MRPLVGYRTEEFGGGGDGISDPIAIATFERKELGNMDIQYYLHDTGKTKDAKFSSAIAFIKKMEALGYIRAKWVCRSAKRVASFASYYWNTQGKLPKIDKYIFNDYIIISEVGSDLLVLYKSSKMSKARLQPLKKR